MIEIKFKIWPYLKPTGQVAIRVLWNSCKTKCEFSTEVYAEKSKWNDDMHRVEKPRVFAPRGRVALTPSGEILLTLCGEIKMTPEKHTFFRGFL